MEAIWKKHTLIFKFGAGTSRGILKKHDVYFIKLFDENEPEVFGIGEAAPLEGLSIDHRPDFEENLARFTSNLGTWDDNGLRQFPSISFALETAIMDLQNGGKRRLFDTGFYNLSNPLPINGLIWMSDKATMQQQIAHKLKEGFTTIKLKIGAINFDDELQLIKEIRQNFNANEVEIRVDANGAFQPAYAMEKLERLAAYKLHSIEQPVAQGQWEAMAALCEKSPLPIALDEELIGIHYADEKQKLLETIRPHYIILKPTLLGGFRNTEEWIKLAENKGIGWWLTSALESNIGLNAICQFTSKFDIKMAQGLGTGSLYENNITSPLEVKNGHIFYDRQKEWGNFYF